VAGGHAARIGGTVVMRLPAILRPRGQHRAPRTPAPFKSSLPDGGRWLVCGATACANLSRPHAPGPNGTWTCTSCGTTKGEQ
jgi:hypothetical protein